MVYRDVVPLYNNYTGFTNYGNITPSLFIRRFHLLQQFIDVSRIMLQLSRSLIGILVVANQGLLVHPQCAEMSIWFPCFMITWINSHVSWEYCHFIPTIFPWHFHCSVQDGKASDVCWFMSPSKSNNLRIIHQFSYYRWFIIPFRDISPIVAIFIMCYNRYECTSLAFT